jgi:hypothetical protein
VPARVDPVSDSREDGPGGHPRGVRGRSDSERGKPTTAARASGTRTAFDRCAALGARAVRGDHHSGAWAANAVGGRRRRLADGSGRYGRLEWRGVEAGEGPAHGIRRVYAYTPRGRTIARLLAVAGVNRWQTGDDEAAVWIAAEAVAALRTVARLFRTRVRRAPETGRSALALAEIRPRPESPIAAG